MLLQVRMIIIGPVTFSMTVSSTKNNRPTKPVLSRLDELLIKFSDSNNEVCDCSNHIEVAYNDVVNLLNVSAAAFQGRI